MALHSSIHRSWTKECVNSERLAITKSEHCDESGLSCISCQCVFAAFVLNYFFKLRTLIGSANADNTDLPAQLKVRHGCISKVQKGV
jgi:hypothetical protein